MAVWLCLFWFSRLKKNSFIRSSRSFFYFIFFAILFAYLDILLLDLLLSYSVLVGIMFSYLDEDCQNVWINLDLLLSPSLWCVQFCTHYELIAVVTTYIFQDRIWLQNLAVNCINDQTLYAENMIRIAEEWQLCSMFHVASWKSCAFNVFVRFSTGSL